MTSTFRRITVAAGLVAAASVGAVGVANAAPVAPAPHGGTTTTTPTAPAAHGTAHGLKGTKAHATKAHRADGVKGTKAHATKAGSKHAALASPAAHNGVTTR